MTADELIAHDLGRAIMEMHKMRVAGQEISAKQLAAYQLMAQIIRSEQMSYAEVVEKMLSDPAFAAWYHSKFGG